MTEAEWLAGDDWQAMLRALGPRASARKLRLFACACCRAVSHRLHDVRSRAAIDLAERYADGAATDDERFAALEASDAVVDDSIGFGMKAYYAACAVEALVENPTLGLYNGSGEAAEALGTAPSEPLPHADLLREHFGNPFRPVVPDPAWRTSDVVLLAAGAYQERAFDRLPVLADALQDAGCSSDDLLAHLRDPRARHARGCWALDLVLGNG